MTSWLDDLDRMLATRFASVLSANESLELTLPSTLRTALSRFGETNAYLDNPRLYRVAEALTDAALTAILPQLAARHPTQLGLMMRRLAEAMGSIKQDRQTAHNCMDLMKAIADRAGWHERYTEEQAIRMALTYAKSLLGRVYPVNLFVRVSNTSFLEVVRDFASVIQVHRLVCGDDAADEATNQLVRQLSTLA